MDRSKKYFYNALLLSVVTVLIRGVTVSFNAYVTQKIGSEAIGLFTLVMSVYALAVTLGCSGVNLAAVRLTSQRIALLERANAGEKEIKKALRHEMGGCLIYSLFFGVFASLLLYTLSTLISSYVLCDVRTVLSLKVLSFAITPISLSSALAGYFTGLRKIYKNAIISMGEQLVKIIVTAGALVLIAPRGIEYACLAVVGGSAISEGASLILSFILYILDKNKGYESISIKAKSADKEKKGPLSKAFEIAFPTALGSYVRQGLLCAEHIAIPAGLRKFGNGSSSALSSYGTLHAMAFPLIFFPSSIIGAFATLLIPELSECTTLQKENRINSIAKKVVEACLIFSFGCAGVFFAFGDDMGRAIYNSSEAGRYILAIAPLVPIMYLDTATDCVLKGIGKELYCMKINIIDSLLSLILVLITVPRLGTWGYIICVYAAEILNFALSFTKMISATRLKFSFFWVLRPLLSILLSATFVRAIASFIPYFDTPFFKISLCALVYSLLIIPKSDFLKRKSYKREKSAFTP